MIGKLFVTTFLVIFLAELGDKTQLAVMARAASASARWTVFLAASLALVTSTLVAVCLGRQLTRIVPEPFLRLGAAIVFILFGLIMLVEALRVAPSREAAAEIHRGPLTRLALVWAADFEKSGFEDYRVLADQVRDPDLKALFERLALEEEGHFHRIRNLEKEHEHAHLDETGKGTGSWVARKDLPHQRPAGETDDEILARDALEHEGVTAAFYRELARMTLLPSLSGAFTWLAEAEEDHAGHVEAWLSKHKPG